MVNLTKEEIKTALDKAQKDMEAHLKENPWDEWELSAWLNLANAGFTPNKKKPKPPGLEKKEKKK